MAILVSEIFAEARGMLNDPTGAIYLDAPMLILMKKVYREMQTKMSKYGISTAKELSGAITVPVATRVLADGGLLPSDLLYPIELFERLSGSTDNYISMEERGFEPEEDEVDNLRYWVWREDSIKFLGALTARQVKIRYMAGLASPTATTSTILILNSQTYLSARLASVAAFVIGSNPTRAKVLQDDADTAWGDFIVVAVRRKQSIPVRRRRTRYRVW